MGTQTEREVLQDYLKDLDHCRDQLGLTAWEQDFVDSLLDKTFLENLSPKQKATLLGMADKYL